MVTKPGNIVTVTIAAKQNMTKISQEKEYWEKMADEYQKKIQLLKEAKARAQTARAQTVRAQAQQKPPPKAVKKATQKKPQVCAKCCVSSFCVETPCR